MHKTTAVRDPAAAFPLPGGRDDVADRRAANRAVAVSAAGQPLPLWPGTGRGPDRDRDRRGHLVSAAFAGAESTRSLTWTSRAAPS